VHSATQHAQPVNQRQRQVASTALLRTCHAGRAVSQQLFHNSTRQLGPRATLPHAAAVPSAELVLRDAVWWADAGRSRLVH
jgi:hypothetical protein